MSTYMRVVEAIVKFLEEKGNGYLFCGPRNAMSPLWELATHSPGINVIEFRDEAVAALAASGYAQYSGKVSVCCASGWAGATNVLTGLVDTWQNASPVLFITDQSKLSRTLLGSDASNHNVSGTYSIDFVNAVRSVTKYAIAVREPALCRYLLDKAYYRTTSGRTGPAVLDFPADIQGAIVDEQELEPFDVSEEGDGSDEVSSRQRAFITRGKGLAKSEESTQALADAMMVRLAAARKPVILAGMGVRTAGAVSVFREIINKLGVPVVTTQIAKDLISNDSDLFMGHPGPLGDQAANYAVQNCDLLLSVGCSLHPNTVGHDLHQFAPLAYKVLVSPDEPLLQKAEEVANLQIRASAGDFLAHLSGALTRLNSAWDDTAQSNPSKESDWVEQCLTWKRNFHADSEARGITDQFAKLLSDLSEVMGTDTVVVTDARTAYEVVGQSFQIRSGQRLIVMGNITRNESALPAAIGVALGVARDHSNAAVLCLTSSESLLAYVTELETIKKYALNIVILSFQKGRVYKQGGELEKEDVPVDLSRVSSAYGIDYVSKTKSYDLRDVVNAQGPVICEIVE